MEDYRQKNMKLVIFSGIQKPTSELSKLDNIFYEDAINLLNTETGVNYLDNKLCLIANVEYIDKNCVYKDKKSCDSSYDWQKILNYNLL